MEGNLRKGREKNKGETKHKDTSNQIGGLKEKNRGHDRQVWRGRKKRRVERDERAERDEPELSYIRLAALVC